MEFQVLGTLQVRDSTGCAVEIRGRLLRALLGALVLDANRPVSDDRLCRVLWGDNLPSAAPNALQAHISKLRKALSAVHDSVTVEKEAGGYVLTVEPSSIDAVQFVELAGLGRAQFHAGQPELAVEILRGAMNLWRGAAYADFEFDEFADSDRVRLEELRLTAIEDCIDAELASGRHDAVVAELEGLIATSPLRERLWGLLMTALYRSGRQADALRAFQRAREHLADELGLDPGVELRELEAKILSQDRSVDAPARTHSRVTRRSNVSPELSTFVGRDDELHDLESVLSTRRLVTIVGPGGVGKTRLATEAALLADPATFDGVWLIDLTTGSGPDIVIEGFLRTFVPSIGPAAPDRLDRLVDALADERALIVLDNCEHVLTEAAAVTGAVLRTCPAITILATSREALGVPGEVVRVLDALSPADGAALFRSRATDAAGSVDADSETIAAIASICSGVDHLPLAIELAAARTRAFSVAQLAKVLRERPNLLSSSGGARPSRQQAMQATVEWSYGLLFEAEQRLLARLSIFRGGFTIASATAVCGDGELDPDDIGLLLARLVDKSLVARVHGGRFDLLAAVREFASVRLAEFDQVGALRLRHLGWLVDATEGLTRGLRGPQPWRWAHLLRDEELNLFAASQAAAAGGDLSTVLRLGCQISWYGFVSANFDQDVSLMLGLLEHSEGLAPELRCRTLMWAGMLAIGRTGVRSPHVDSIEAARSIATFAVADTTVHLADGGTGLVLEALEIARALDDQELLVEVIGLAAFRLAASGSDSAQAAALVAEGTRLADAQGDRWTKAFLRMTAGLLAVGRREIELANELLTESRAHFIALGDVGTAALVDASLAEVAIVRGDTAAARRSLEAAVEFSAAAGFRSAAALRARLVWLACCDGDAQRSLELGREYVDSVARVFNPMIRAHSVFALGSAESLAELDDDAAAHLSEALSVYERFGVVREAALARTELGYIAERRGDPEDSLQQHRLALQSALRLDSGMGLVPAVVGLASAHLCSDDLVAGRGLLEFANTALASSKFQLPMRDRTRLDAARRRAAEMAVDTDDEMSRRPDFCYADLEALAAT